MKINKSELIKKYIKLKERHYNEDGVRVPYIFSTPPPPPKNQNLIVVFSGFAGYEIPARYNLIKTLFFIKADKLFILDSFGYNNVGSYYLGDSCCLLEHNTICNLLNRIIRKGYQNIIFAGSSKGGTSALLYGLKLQAHHIIIGSPQYRIGDYLLENEYHRKILNAIIGTNDTVSVTILNSLVNDEIKKCVSRGNAEMCKVHLLYSSEESSYKKDVSFLIDDLETNHIVLDKEDKQFASHDEIGLHFPNYLLKKLEELNIK